MRENNRKPIEKCRKKLPQFTTMNVIDGQAGLVIYSSLIFYSLTIDNILNIIVLLILAGVTIATLTGENGILTRASDAAEQTEKANVIEQAKTDILGIQAEKKDGNITKGELKTVLDTYFKTVPDDYTTETVLETKNEYGNHEIAVSEIYNGNLGETQEVISKTESFVGYYADIDGDKTIDGIIYADLTQGNTKDGQWTDSDGNYEIPKVESGLKDYYISKTDYEGDFGIKDVLSPTGSGAGRFYVMALSDIDANTHYWYYNAYGIMGDYATATSGNFGTGKANTETMIAKWNNSSNGGYGEQNANDMWGLIQNEVENGWFVPSRGEWSAFAEELGITTNYSSFGLSDWYWSSSQSYTTNAYCAYFDYGYVNSNSVNTTDYVRLSTTF